MSRIEGSCLALKKHEMPPFCNKALQEFVQFSRTPASIIWSLNLNSEHPERSEEFFTPKKSHFHILSYFRLCVGDCLTDQWAVFMSIRAFFIHTHIFICAFETVALCEHILVWGWSRGSFIVVPTGADVAGTYSILSLILSLRLLHRSGSRSLFTSLYVFLSSALFLLRPDGEELLSKPFSLRIAMHQVMWSSLLSPPYLSVPLCFSLSISARAPSFPVSFPPDKARQRPFISP